MRSLLLTGWALIVLAPDAADACRCEQQTLSAYFERAEFVAIAKLESSDDAGDQRVLEFELLSAPHKGAGSELNIGSTVQIHSAKSSAACAVPVEVDAIYIVFAYSPGGDSDAWQVDTCSGTRIHLSPERDAPAGFVDVPARFVAQQLNALYGLDVVRDVAAHAPKACDADNESVIGLLDLKALAHGGHVNVLARQGKGADVLATIHTYDDLEAREVGYEVAAALVFARRSGWSRVRLADARYGWVAPHDAGTWSPYADLPVRRLAYLTEEWSGLVWPDIGAGIPLRVNRDTADLRKEYPAEVLESAEIGGTLWFRVAVLKSDPCSGGDRQVHATGWVPGYGRHGKPNVWFYSRGC